MKRTKKSIFLLALGIILIIIGGILTYFSLSSEVLDNDYVIDQIEEFTSSENSLTKGQVEVVQNILYQGEGTFKIEFINRAKESNNKILKDNSNLIINDDISKDYHILNKIIINDKEYSFKSNEYTSQEKIKIKNDDNNLTITIPSNIILTENKIAIFVKLIGRDKNKNLYTNKDSYYSIEPNNENDFYAKSGKQSYIIYGKGSITLK